MSEQAEETPHFQEEPSYGSLQTGEGRGPFSEGLTKLVLLPPKSACRNLGSGDVLASHSGNIRLVLSVELKGSEKTATFLTKLSNGAVRIENAVLSKINVKKITAVVRRRQGNPLKKFMNIAQNLLREKAILHNVRILLGVGIIGEEIREVLSHWKKQNEQVAIDMYVSRGTGMIKNIYQPLYQQEEDPVQLCFRCTELPTDEYIYSAIFRSRTSATVKESILAASVFANTIENASNFLTARPLQ